ncbi:MAG: hypothetical protein GHHEDOFH_03484 [Pseudorhodoplanes sp.]|nr:hypothetical protein [Pseudorhodoplanes sp.]
MRNVYRTALKAVLLAGLAAGCSVAPAVQYEEVIKPDTQGLPKFKLQSSIIAIDFKRDDKGVPLAGGQMVIMSIPAEDPSGRLYAIRAADQWGVNTRLQMTPRENNLLISSLGVEVEDQRVATIQQVAAFATKFLAIPALWSTSVAPGKGKETKTARVAEPFPAIIDVSRVHLLPEDTGGAQEFENGRFNGIVRYGIKYGPVEPSATPRSGFDFSTTRSVYIYSACRDALLTFDYPPGKRHTATVRIADPNFIETIALPAKGKVSAQSACGVSVSSEAVKTNSTLEVLNALFDAAKTVRDAEEAKRTAKSGATTAGKSK